MKKEIQALKQRIMSMENKNESEDVAYLKEVAENRMKLLREIKANLAKPVDLVDRTEMQENASVASSNFGAAAKRRMSWHPNAIRYWFFLAELKRESLDLLGFRLSLDAQRT